MASQITQAPRKNLVVINGRCQAIILFLYKGNKEEKTVRYRLQGQTLILTMAIGSGKIPNSWKS